MKLATLFCMSYKVKWKYPFHRQNLEVLVSDLQSRVEAQDRELDEIKQKLKEKVSNNLLINEIRLLCHYEGGRADKSKRYITKGNARSTPAS